MITSSVASIIKNLPSPLNLACLLALIKKAIAPKKLNGNLTNKWGRFVENLVHGDLINLLPPWEITVKVVWPRMVYPEHRGNSAGEFHLVAMNSEEVVVIEVKSTLKVSDINKFAGKLHMFQEALPDYKKKTIYAGVAYLELAQGALEVAKNKGLFMIKAPRR